jgi:hypothetical protein
MLRLLVMLVAMKLATTTSRRHARRRMTVQIRGSGGPRPDPDPCWSRSIRMSQSAIWFQLANVRVATPKIADSERSEFLTHARVTGDSVQELTGRIRSRNQCVDRAWSYLALNLSTRTPSYGAAARSNNVSGAPFRCLSKNARVYDVAISKSRAASADVFGSL